MYVTNKVALSGLLDVLGITITHRPCACHLLQNRLVKPPIIPISIQPLRSIFQPRI